MPRRAPEIALSLPPRERAETLAAWLYRGLRAAILSGRLHRGARVPATRDLGVRHGVSRGVVVSAYERLHDEGYVRLSITYQAGMADASGRCEV